MPSIAVWRGREGGERVRVGEGREAERRKGRNRKDRKEEGEK